MSNDDRLMSFEEFRTSHEAVLQQQNEFFRDREAAEEVLHGPIGVKWTVWPASAMKVTV
ncbi:MAG TPA: hypothetical protein VGQ76_07355 [Thermoanaerobaculia bacterium]|jgi:hypothetical protein|nr:hypothetical protein [Thermoanaerobaculia bacterium]